MGVKKIRYSENGKYKSLSGKYIPLNPGKYKGKHPHPEYKSSLEYKMMKYLDKNPAILEWTYEPMGIEYYDTLRKKTRKYYLDFIAKTHVGGGFIKTILIEVKCKKETIEPKKTSRMSDKTYREAMKTWLTNNAKWAAAKKFAKAKNYEFVIINETHLS